MHMQTPAHLQGYWFSRAGVRLRNQRFQQASSSPPSLVETERPQEQDWVCPVTTGSLSLAQAPCVC